MADNTDLHSAKAAKRDEWYTQREDIERELGHYEAHFDNKVVYCNCDDPWESNFFKYFAAKFNDLNLKKLIATSYSGSPIAGTQLGFDDIGVENGRRAHKIEITEVSEKDGVAGVNLGDVEWLLRNDANVCTNLEDNGDFCSPECVALLEEADIVVTNPPFSLFRQYVAQIIECNKKFLILGHQNAITYKEIFPLIKEGIMWLGHYNGGTKWFRVPPDYDINTESRKKTENGIKYISMGQIWWFTNLEHAKRHKEIPLFCNYNPDDYPHYDNYDAINVDKTAEIPDDWEGAMGVPITFLDKHNPDQFEIVKFRKGDDNKDLRVNGKEPYFRIVIRKRETKHGD